MIELAEVFAFVAILLAIICHITALGLTVQSGYRISKLRPLRWGLSPNAMAVLVAALHELGVVLASFVEVGEAPLSWAFAAPFILAIAWLFARLSIQAVASVCVLFMKPN